MNTILSKIFGNKPKQELTVSAEVMENQVLDAIPNIPENLFIDKNQPEIMEEIPEVETSLKKFLDKNHQGYGERDGYRCHSLVMLESSKKQIKSEFRLIIDQMLQEKQLRVFELKQLIVQLSGISETTIQQLRNNIDELQSAIEVLEKQKLLSSEDEGWVMVAVHSYHIGFMVGLEDYIQSESLLNSFKNL